MWLYMEIGPSKRKFTLNEEITVEPSFNRTDVLRRRGRDTVVPTRLVHTHGKEAMWRQWEGAVCKPRTSLQRPNLLAPWSWNYSLQNGEKINGCYSSQSVAPYGSLSRLMQTLVLGSYFNKYLKMWLWNWVMGKGRRVLSCKVQKA